MPPACHFNDRIHCTSCFASASLTCGLAGMGTGPQTPAPPFITFCTSRAGASGWLAYLAATSLKAGPISFESIWWHEKQFLLFASASFARAGAAAMQRLSLIHISEPTRQAE